jgi:hypothetical protein
MKGSPEGRALLSLLRASLSETFPDPTTVPSSLDWLLLKRLARHHRVGPLLSYSLRRSRIHGIPGQLRSEWDAQRREAVATSLYHLQALAKLAELFDSRNLPFILLKGEALSQTCYPDEGLRPYDDIDLLIKEDSYEAVKAALIAYGFHLRHPHLETEKRELFGEVEFDQQGPRTLTVDLHWDTLMASWGPPSLLGDTIAWEFPDQIQIGRQIVSVLGGEILLLHLCVHFTFHHALDGLILLCDLFLVLRRDDNRIDWDRLLRQADRYRCRHAVYYALSCVQSLLGAHIPSSILDRLKPAIPVRLLMPVGRLLLRDHAVPQLLERYIKLLLIDDQSDRWQAARCWWRSSKPWLIKRSRAPRCSDTTDIAVPRTHEEDEHAMQR